MRKPNCSERNAALGILRDADQGVVQLSPDERDCLARLALAALMDECLDDATFEAADAALERGRYLGSPLSAADPVPPLRRRGAQLSKALGQTSRRWAAALHATPARRRVAVAGMVGLAAIVGPIAAFSGGEPGLQQAKQQSAAGLAGTCLADVQGQPVHAELVALKQTADGAAAACAKPGPRSLTDASHHG